MFLLFCLALCFLLFILGVPMTTQGGAYIFQVFISTKLNTKCDITYKKHILTLLRLKFFSIIVDGFLQRKWNSYLVVLFLSNNRNWMDLWCIQICKLCRTDDWIQATCVLVVDMGCGCPRNNVCK